MGAVAHEHPALPVDAALLEHGQLGEHGLGIDDHAGAEDDGLIRIEDPRGDEVQGELLAAAHDGVAGVGAAGEANDDLRLGGQVIDHLALAFVAPLGPDQH